MSAEERPKRNSKRASKARSEGQPRLTSIVRNHTHRLIPTRYADDAEGVLARLALPQSQFDNLLQLEGATNDRVTGEANLLPGISVHELVFGVPYYHIVNAAFTYARPGGTVSAVRTAGPGVRLLSQDRADRSRFSLRARIARD